MNDMLPFKVIPYGDRTRLLLCFFIADTFRLPFRICLVTTFPNLIATTSLPLIPTPTVSLHGQKEREMHWCFFFGRKRSLLYTPQKRSFLWSFLQAHLATISQHRLSHQPVCFSYPLNSPLDPRLQHTWKSGFNYPSLNAIRPFFN